MGILETLEGQNHQKWRCVSLARRPVRAKSPQIERVPNETRIDHEETEGPYGLPTIATINLRALWAASLVCQKLFKALYK